jgi:hypothetical protein
MIIITLTNQKNKIVWRWCGWIETYSSVYDIYRGTDKSLSRPDWKKQLKGRHFSSDAEVIAASETWLDRQQSELFLSGLQMLEFGRCSFLFPGRVKDLSAPQLK